MRRQALVPLMVLLASAAVADEAPPATAGTVQESACGGEPGLDAAWVTRVVLPGGLEVGFRTETAGRSAAGNDRFPQYTGGTQTNAAHRVVADRSRGAYAGYRLEVEPSPEGEAFHVAIKPLPQDFELPKESGFGSSPPSTVLRSKLARYPRPFLASSGVEFLVELLVNPTTGEKLVDRVKIVRARPFARRATGWMRVNVKLEWESPREPGDSRILVASVCVRDAKGKLLSNPRLRITPDAETPQSGEIRQGIQVEDRDFMMTMVMTVEPGGKGGIYSVELRGAEGILYAEEVRFPLAS